MALETPLCRPRAQGTFSGSTATLASDLFCSLGGVKEAARYVEPTCIGLMLKH